MMRIYLTGQVGGEDELMFPAWDSARMNHRIKECAEEHAWDRGFKWVLHGMRHGLAAHVGAEEPRYYLGHEQPPAQSGLDRWYARANTARTRK